MLNRRLSKRDRAVLPRARALLVLPLLALAACGGGGGGSGSSGGGSSGGGSSGGGSSTAFTITLDRSTLTWSHYEGNAPAQQTINSSSTGTYNGTLYVVVLIENNGAVNAIQPQIPITVNGTQATAQVTPALGLAAGVYTGRIVVSACSDQACSNRVGGTPLTVGFTVNVLASVKATPSTVTKTVTSGSGVTEDIVVVPGESETGFSIGQPLSPIVQVSNQTAGGFRVTLPSLPVGSYSAAIPLTGSLGSRATLPISYTVTAPPGGQQPLSVSPMSLTFATSERATPPAQTVQVTEATWRPGMLPPVVEYAQGQGWLDVSNVAGGYRVAASAASLAAGTYTATLYVRSNTVPPGVQEPSFNTLQQPVSVSVTVGPGLIRPADVLHVIDSETTAGELGGSVVIGLNGGPPATWQATSSAPWLVIDTPSATTGTALQYSIDEAWLAAAENFARHTATITVSAPGTVLTPTSFAVAVEPRLSEISGVGPHVVLAGQASTLVVSGRGFGAVADLAARLKITPTLQPATLQRVGDYKLLLTFASLTAGGYEVSIDNALGIPTRKGTVVSKFATPRVYGTAATGEHIDALVVDHERDVLYGVRRNGYNGSLASLNDGLLYRFTPGGPSGWTGGVVGPPAVDDVAVLFGGDVAVMTTSPGVLRILDGATLAEKHNVFLSCTGRHDQSEGGMPVTLDGRVWFAISFINQGCAGNPRWGELASFDPVSRVLELFDVPLNTTPPIPPRFPNGPDSAVVRSGERLVLQTGQSAPFATLVELDVASATMTPVPGGGWGRVLASDNGHRLLVDAVLLVDGQFAPIGELHIPDYTSPIDTPARAAAIMAPDGQRAYVLTYRSSDLLPGVPPPTTPPRVYVFDTSASGVDPPLLGYFEVADYPSCTDTLSGCDPRAVAAISLDGNTLFFAGDTLLVVAPVPSSLLQP